MLHSQQDSINYEHRKNTRRILNGQNTHNDWKMTHDCLKNTMPHAFMRDAPGGGVIHYCYQWNPDFNFWL